MSLKRVAFWFLRHGETDWNALHLAQGRADNPLNANGLAQAEAAAVAMAGVPIGSIVSSPMRRALDTASVVARARGLDVEVLDDLVEAEFGDHEGKPMAGWFGRWVDEGYTPPGAESFASLTERAVRAFGEALTRPGPVLVVAHGALWRGVRGVMGLSPDVRTRNGVPILAEPVDGGWRLTPDR